MKWRKDAEQHARECYPKESCGLLIKVAKQVKYKPFDNNSSDPENHFVIRAEDYALAEDAGEIVGLVHSHPNAAPRPSDADKVMAEQLGIPSHIVALGELDEYIWETYTPAGYKAPLIGRDWGPPLLDCYSLVKDYYERELNIQLPFFEHDMHFDDRGDDIYLRNCENAGFINLGQIRDVREHDLIVMQIRSPLPNHGAIYLGDYQIKSEPCTQQSGAVLHHLFGQLSKRDQYVGYWVENTRYVFRHKELL